MKGERGSRFVAPVMGTDDDDMRHASDDILSSRFRKTKGFGAGIREYMLLIKALRTESLSFGLLPGPG